uniref:MFS domain-containing protein n=1 Tax=Heterorhabditis bacteriophora TaxID=37862 RepID=A0A1I7WXT7_HETBA
MKTKTIQADDIGCLTTRTRYIILFLGSACISSIASNMITLNFTLICMGKSNNESSHLISETRETYNYDQREKSYLMWAVAIGTLLAAWPFQWFYQKFGARSVFFAAGMISTISTGFIPYAAAYSFNAFLVARFFQGISFGADFAAIGLIVVYWASLKQHGLFISFLSSFSQISVMFTMPVAGELCESSLGWQSVYYIHAAVSGILFIAWFYYYRLVYYLYSAFQNDSTLIKGPRQSQTDVYQHEFDAGELAKDSPSDLSPECPRHCSSAKSWCFDWIILLESEANASKTLEIWN